MTWARATRIVLAGFVTGLLVSCGVNAPGDMPSRRSAGNGTNQRVFQVKGVVKEVMLARKKVKIAHEEIPNYMAPMTMEFDVKDVKELDGLQPGDAVAFRMIVTENDGWVEQLAKISAAPPVTPPAPAPLRRVREVDPLKEGDLLPEYHFTNELGQAIRLSDYKGKALVLTFIFTRCPFPTYCPRMSSSFAETSAKLKAMPNAPANWHLLTITFDPEFDTPAVLKSYGQRYQYDPKHWSFVTGDLIDITAIAEQFGLLFWKPDANQPAGINHNLRTVVVDAQGRVQKILSQNEWTTTELVAEIVKAAGVKPGP